MGSHSHYYISTLLAVYWVFLRRIKLLTSLAGCDFLLFGEGINITFNLHFMSKNPDDDSVLSSSSTVSSTLWTMYEELLLVVCIAFISMFYANIKRRMAVLWSDWDCI